jgi:hypothetical protein
MADKTTWSVYMPRLINDAGRVRSTREQVEARRSEMIEIVDRGRPMTVRQVFYQSTVRGLVPKTETGGMPSSKAT